MSDFLRELFSSDGWACFWLPTLVGLVSIGLIFSLFFLAASFDFFRNFLLMLPFILVGLVICFFTGNLVLAIWKR